VWFVARCGPTLQGKSTFAVRQNLCRAFYFGRTANTTFTVCFKIRCMAKKKCTTKISFATTRQRGSLVSDSMHKTACEGWRLTVVKCGSREPHVPGLCHASTTKTHGKAPSLPCVTRRRTTKVHLCRVFHGGARQNFKKFVISHLLSICPLQIHYFLLYISILYSSQIF
jgi:hypothetical protein